MAWTRVRNRKGTGDQKCGTCPSWLQHWENGTGQTKSLCGVNGNKDVLGGHVIKVGGYDKASYIVPICASCNARTDEFEVLWDLHPVVSSYSGKQ